MIIGRLERLVYPLVVIGLLIMYLMPLWTKVIPAPLVAIVLLTAAAVVFALNVPTVGDQGDLLEEGCASA